VDLAVEQEDDAVVVLHGGQPVRDRDDGVVLAETLDGLDQCGFREVVESPTSPSASARPASLTAHPSRPSRHLGREHLGLSTVSPIRCRAEG
jgi:hypothetical protein